MERTLTVLVALLLLTSGCQGFLAGPETTHPAGGETATEARPVYTEHQPRIRSLQLSVENVSAREGGGIEGRVTVGGQFEGLVYGITVLFLDAEGVVVKSVDVGNLSTSALSVPDNATLPTLPVSVVTVADSWNTPNTTFDQSVGYRITASGEFRPFELVGRANATY